MSLHRAGIWMPPISAGIAAVTAFLATPGTSSLRKNSTLLLFLGGAALQRCGKCIVLNPALAAEGTALAQKRLFPQPANPRARLLRTPLRPRAARRVRPRSTHIRWAAERRS